MFHDDALLDRFHGIIPGWKIPRFTTDCAAKGYGIKADVFGQFYTSLDWQVTLSFLMENVPR